MGSVMGKTGPGGDPGSPMFMWLLLSPVHSAHHPFTVRAVAWPSRDIISIQGICCQEESLRSFEGHLALSTSREVGLDSVSTHGMLSCFQLLNCA